MAVRASTSVRLDESQVARLDRIVAAMQSRLAGLDVGRSTALRLALERGMDALDAELRLTRRGRTAGKAEARPSKPRPSKAKPSKAKPSKLGKAKPSEAKSKPSKRRKTESGKTESGKAGPVKAKRLTKTSTPGKSRT